MPRKRIHIITPHFTPEITAAAHRMEALATSLSAAFEVHVYTLAGNNPFTTGHPVKNITVHYSGKIKYNKSVFLFRAFWELWYSFQLVRKANKQSSSMTIVTIPFMFLLPVVARFSSSGKLIADIRDIVWHYLPENNFFKRGLKRMLTRVMHSSLQKFDEITVTNHAELRWLVNNASVSESKISLIPNGIPSDKFTLLSEVNYKIHPQKFIITYVGNLGSSQEFYDMIDAVKQIKSVRLNLIGDGNQLNDLRKYVRKNKITNVFLPGKLKWMRVVPYYQNSNLLFASLKKEYDTAIPSKLYEYLATGLPVLYVGGGVADFFLREFKNTFRKNTASPEALRELVWNIKKLAMNRSWKNKGIIGRYFIREKVSQHFVEICAKHLNEKTLSDVFIEDILAGE